MAQGELNPHLGIIGALHDVFNRIARECDEPQAQPLLSDMAERFDKLAYRALCGSFGAVAGRPQTLQQALDHVFEPMVQLHTLGQDNSVINAIWDDARKTIDSFETPVVAALQKFQQVAPDKPIDVMQPIRFRYGQSTVAA